MNIDIFRGIDNRQIFATPQGFLKKAENVLIDTTGMLHKMPGCKLISTPDPTEGKLKYSATEFFYGIDMLQNHDDYQDVLIAYAGRKNASFDTDEVLFPHIYNPAWTTDVDWKGLPWPSTIPVSLNAGVHEVQSPLSYLKRAYILANGFPVYYDAPNETFVDGTLVSKDYFDTELAEAISNGTITAEDAPTYVIPKGVYLEEHQSRMFLCGTGNRANMLLYTQPFSDNFYTLQGGVPVLLEVSVGQEGSAVGTVNDRLTVCKEWSEILYIFKERSIHRLIGDQLVNYYTTVVNKTVGCDKPRTLIRTQAGLIFTYKQEVYLLNNTTTRISDPVRKELTTLPSTAGASLMDERYYVLEWDEKTLIYDIQTGAWTTCTHRITGDDNYITDGTDIMRWGVGHKWKIGVDNTGGDSIPIYIDTGNYRYSDEIVPMDIVLTLQSAARSQPLKIRMDNREHRVMQAAINSRPRIDQALLDRDMIYDLPYDVVYTAPLVSGRSMRLIIEHDDEYAYLLRAINCRLEPVDRQVPGEKA